MGDYFNSNSIIDITKKVGIHTSWYSNQSTHGRMNAKVTYIGKNQIMYTTPEKIRWDIVVFLI